MIILFEEESTCGSHVGVFLQEIYKTSVFCMKPILSVPTDAVLSDTGIPSQTCLVAGFTAKSDEI
jgi:hypothetical protein